MRAFICIYSPIEMALSYSAAPGHGAAGTGPHLDAAAAVL
jgi:hypothetical protein